MEYLHGLSRRYLFGFSLFYFLLSTIILICLVPKIIPGIDPILSGIDNYSDIHNLYNTINPLILIILLPILIILSIAVKIFALTSVIFFIVAILGFGPINLGGEVIGFPFSKTPNPTTEEITIFSLIALTSFILSLIAIKFLRNKNYSFRFLLFWILIVFIGVLIFYQNYTDMLLIGKISPTIYIMLGHSVLTLFSALCLYFTKNKDWVKLK